MTGTNSIQMQEPAPLNKQSTLRYVHPHNITNSYSDDFQNFFFFNIQVLFGCFPKSFKYIFLNI